MSLKDTFAKLKTSIVGTKTSDLDVKLDRAVRDIVSYKSNAGKSSYIELVKSLISKGGSLDIGPNVFQQGTTPASMGQGTRLARYKAYEAIVTHISYCQRALNVLTDNILAPDDITKTALEVNPKSFIENSENSQSNVKDVEEVIHSIKLEERLDMIVKNTLHFGDFFCEIADSKTALTSKSAFLSENFSTYQQNFDSVKDVINEKLDDKNNIKIILDFSSMDDMLSGGTKEKSQLDDKKGKLKPTDVHLLLYDPKRIVKLQSDMFPVCFGYLIFPQSIMSPQLMVQNQVVNTLCQSILKSVQKRVPGLQDSNVNLKDLEDIVTTMVRETDYTKAMNIRYVPPDRMQHFHIPSTKYYPYGESIFDGAQFNAKIFIAMEVAITILRLNRSIEKRKISVEVGLPRDARTAIEKLKEEFKKRKICLDSFGSVDSIPSQVSSFEDIFIPQKDGKPFVDINTFAEGNADVRSKVDELKFIRDSIVSGLTVPPAFIGLEENSSAKAQLSEENVIFARAIVNHQKYLTHQITELIKKLYNILNPEKALTILEDVLIALPSPKSLQFERQAAYISNLVNLVESLERIGVPKDWSKKHYLTSIDWDEVKQHEIDEKIDKSLAIEVDPNAMGGGGMDMMGGGLGGMGGGMGGGM